MDKVNGSSPREIGILATKVGIARARLGWVELILKSFLGGVYISIGALLNLVVAGGSSGLRESNPSIATMIAGFTFPIGEYAN